MATYSLLNGGAVGGAPEILVRPLSCAIASEDPTIARPLLAGSSRRPRSTGRRVVAVVVTAALTLAAVEFGFRAIVERLARELDGG